VITLENLKLSPSSTPLQMTDSGVFTYRGYGNRKATCGLEVYGNIVIATELAENTGTSITNAAESLATDLCCAFGIKPSDLILIEHYEGDRILAEHWDLVKFGVRSDDVFMHPNWFRLHPTELQRLLGKA
jgi:hypothetical protein